MIFKNIIYVWESNTFLSFCFNLFLPIVSNLACLHLMKYIDWYIRMMVTQSPEWENLCVIFSSDKVPGEGEHYFLKTNHIDVRRVKKDKMDMDMKLIRKELKNRVLLHKHVREELYDDLKRERSIIHLSKKEIGK